jgi:hypothetical protein
MTPLGTYTVIYPPSTTYNKTTFTRGMTLISPETVLWRGTSGLVVNQSWNVNLGFSFQFYGQTFSTAYISENGFLTFSATGATSNANRVIPTTTAPNGYIAPFWDYLYTYTSPGTAKISYNSVGSAPIRIFTAQLYLMNTPGYSASYRSGQVVLYETTNVVEIKYHTSQNWITGSATIGIENHTGTAGVGGPNTGATNNTPPTVNYRFTPVSGTYDDVATLVNFPFSFNFFGNNYVQAYVSTNGFITFTGAATGDASNDAIPTATTPNNIIALFWDDLIVATNGVTDQIRYGTTGTAPNRVFSIEYYGITRKGQTASEMTGQIVLYETSHRIELHYDASASNNNWLNVSATIGIEDSAGTTGFGGPSTTNTIAAVPGVNYRWDPITTFNLNVASAQGTPTPAVGNHLYNNGSSVTASVASPVPAGAGQQYRCTGWTGTGSVPSSGTTTSVTFTISQTSSITWNWVLEMQLTLTPSPAAGGTPTSVPAGPWIQPGTMVTIHANPNSGYVFNSWSGAISSINNPESFTLNNPMTITANYIPPSLTLTVGGSPSQRGTPSPNYGTHSYTAGNNVTCTAPSPVAGPAGTRYVCTGWTGTGDVPATGSTNSVSITMTQISTITWNWATEYQLTLNEVPAGAGTTTTSPSGTWFPSGQSVQCTANPNGGYTFTNWTGAITSSTNPDTVVMSAPATVTANYQAQQWTLTVNSAQGSPSPAVGPHLYNSGTPVTCTVASPVSGGAGVRYVCTGWTGTGDVPSTGTGTTANFNITQNSSITWTWQTEYETTLVSNPASGGSIAPTPSGGWYTSGTPVSFLASPNSGYSFQSWSSGLSGTTNPDTLTVTAPVTVTADFLAQGPTLTVISAYGSPTPPVGSQAYLTGTQVTCSVTSPASGGSGVRYICTGWTGTGDVPTSGTGTSVAVTLNADSSITWNWAAEYEVFTAVLPAGSGSVTLTPPGPWYAANTVVAVQAAANGSSRFISWSGDLQSSQNPAPLLVDGAKTVTANFISDVALGIYPGPANPVAGQESTAATGVPMLQLALTAGAAEGVTVASLRVSVTGASDETSTVTGVDLYEDVNGDGAYSVGTDQVVMTGATFASDDGDILFTFVPPLQIGAGEVKYVLVTFDLSAGVGDDFQARIAGSTDVSATSSATSMPLTPVGAPVSGGVKTAVAPSTAGSLEVVTGAMGPAGGYVPPGSSGVVMMQLILRTSSLEGATISDLTLTASGTGDDGANVTQVSLYRDVNVDGLVDGGDVLIAGSGVFSGDDGTVTFTGLGQTVFVGSQVAWLVVYDFGPADTGTYVVQVAGSTDVTATGNTSSTTLPVTGTPATGGLITIGTPPAPVTAGEPLGFAGGCGGPAAGGLPLLPLLPLFWALWFLASRRRRDT